MINDSIQYQQQYPRNEAITLEWPLFAICAKTVISGIVVTKQISRLYASCEAAQQHLAMIQRRYPEASIKKFVFEESESWHSKVLEAQSADAQEFGPLRPDETARLRARDRLRTALQAPIASPKYRVLYLKNGRELQSPWLYRREHAQRALAVMKAKYGEKNAIIYLD